MEYVILGFLMIRSLSQYDLLQALSKEVSPFYRPSLGSIQNALKKLIEKNHIKKSVNTDTGRKKNQYTITESGLKHFKLWMLSDFSETKFETDLNTRLFFLGHFDINERIAIIKKGQLYVSSALAVYKCEMIRFNDMTFSEDFAEIIKYQIKTLDLGIHAYIHLNNWLLKELKEQEDLYER